MDRSSERLICTAADLADGGDGVRFSVTHRDQDLPAFAVRFAGRAHAYLNRCTHRDTQLDWDPGRFFDADRRLLICATHGALYQPDTGKCVGGPCRGGLVKLKVIEKNSAIYLASTDATESGRD